MNKNNAFVKWYMIITLPLILLFSSFYYWMYNDAYFQNQFEKFDVYSGFDLTKEELNIKNSELIYYLKDGSNLIEDNFYNRAEKEHLRDVRVLMQGGTNLLIFLAVMWLTGIFIVKNIFLTFGGLSLTGLFYSWKCMPKKLVK